MPLSVREIDVAFLDLNVLAGFPFALPYYSAVRAAAAVWPSGASGYSTLVDTHRLA